jgi:internalin A
MSQVRDQVFISYSRSDKKWLDKLHAMLTPLLRADKLKIWDDTHILPGKKWYDEITGAIASAKVAVLLVSADFLASDFINRHELALILEAAEKEGLTILWVAVSHSLYQYTEIANYQAVNEPSQPLDSLSPTKLNKELTRICKRIKDEIDR